MNAHPPTPSFTAMVKCENVWPIIGVGRSW